MSNLVVPFRLYGLFGCPHCVAAEGFLSASRIPFQGVPANNDPVLLQGVKTVTGQEHFPVLVSFLEEQVEVIVGFKPEDYERVVKTYNTKFRSIAPDAPAAQSDNSGQAAQVVAEPSPAPQGVA